MSGWEDIFLIGNNKLVEKPISKTGHLKKMLEDTAQLETHWNFHNDQSLFVIGMIIVT